MQPRTKSSIRATFGILLMLIAALSASLIGPWALQAGSSGNSAVVGIALFVVLEAACCVMLFAGIYLLLKR